MYYENKILICTEKIKREQLFTISYNTEPTANSSTSKFKISCGANMVQAWL